MVDFVAVVAAGAVRGAGAAEPAVLVVSSKQGDIGAHHNRGKNWLGAKPVDRNYYNSFSAYYKYTLVRQIFQAFIYSCFRWRRE